MRLYELQEGFTIHSGEGPQGQDVYSYTSKGDDDPLLVSRGIKSTGSKAIPRSTIKDVGSSEAEIEELEPHLQKNTASLQKEITIYTAMPTTTTPLYPPVEDEEGKDKNADTFMDILKGKSKKATFSEKGKNELLSDSAKKVLTQYLTDGGQPKFNYFEHIIITPIPSSSQIAKEFTKKVAEEVQQAQGASGKVEVKDIFQKAAVPKHGYVRRAQTGGGPKARQASMKKKGVTRDTYSYPFPERELSFTKGPQYYAQDIASGWAKEQISDEDIDKLVYNLKARVARKITEITNKLRTASTSQEEQQLRASLQAHQAELDYVNTKLEKDIEKYQNKFTSSQAETTRRRAGEVKALPGMSRELSYDRFTINQSEPFPPRTLLIIVDDNIHKSKSITDLYRSLFKKGLVDQRTVRVVAFVLQRITK